MRIHENCEIGCAQAKRPAGMRPKAGKIDLGSIRPFVQTLVDWPFVYVAEATRSGVQAAYRDAANTSGVRLGPLTHQILMNSCLYSHSVLKLRLDYCGSCVLHLFEWLAVPAVKWSSFSKKQLNAAAAPCSFMHPKSCCVFKFMGGGDVGSH